MQSPPAIMAWTRVSSLRPGRAAPGWSPRSTSWSVACSIPSRSAKVAGNSNPALATARWSSKTTSTRSGTTWEDRIEKVSSGSGIVTAWQPSFSLVRGPFSQSHHYTRPAWSVDRGSVTCWYASKHLRVLRLERLGADDAHDGGQLQHLAGHPDLSAGATSRP